MKHEQATNPAYTEEFIEWFWAQVDKTPCCWLWRKAPPMMAFHGNYGHVKVGKRWTGAHRISYELTYGDIPAGLIICHKCDNPPCVRPDHLFAGTYSDNGKDCHKKGRGRVYYHDLDDGQRYFLVSDEYKATMAGITIEELHRWIEQGLVERTKAGPFGFRYTLAAILHAKEKIFNK